MIRGSWVARRLLQLVPVLIGISIISFVLVHMTPGDPARLILGMRADPEAVEALRTRLGLNDPLLVQYFSYLGQLMRGDLGFSFRYQVPVSQLILQFLPVTAFLALYTICLSVPATIFLAVTAAQNRGSWVDQVIRVFSIIGMTMPVFWLGILMIRLFSVDLGWFPVSGFGKGFTGHLHHLFLPALSISIYLVPVLLRSLRAAILEQAGADYVTAARSKGLPEGYIFRRHILQNASLPTLNLFGAMVAYLIGGTVVVELVYALPGLGMLTYNSILGRDYYVIQGLTLFYAFATVTVTLLTDLLSAWIDPRVNP